MEMLYSSKKPSIKPIAPDPSRKSVIPGSQHSLPGQSERAHYVDSQSTLAVGSSFSEHSDVTFHNEEAESYGNDEGNPHFTRSDNSLISVVTRRLYDLEAMLASHKQQVQDLQLEIRNKDSKIQSLSHQLRNREKVLEDVKCNRTKGSKITIDKTEYEELQKRLEDLRKTVEEMNQFFSDYGVTWVGGRSGYQRKTEESFSVDFTRFLACVDDLNLFVREGESQMVYTSQGATFKMPESVPLTVFSNGLMLFSGPFRDYSDPLTQEFVNDIIDGFFPSELQISYPDGVPFKVIDKHDAMYQDPKLQLKVFGGVGQRLGHMSAGDSLPNADEIVCAKRQTSQKSELILNSGSQVNLDCHDLKLDTRVGVNSTGIGDHADTTHLSSVLDNKVIEARLTYLSSSQNLPQEPLPTKETLPLKPAKHPRNRKLFPVVVCPNPVKKSSAHTNITEKALPDGGCGRMVKDTLTTITYGNDVETFGSSISNQVPPSLNTTMKKSNWTHTPKYKEIETDRIAKTKKSADSAGNAEAYNESRSKSKSIEHNFSSCSTITPETLDNRGFKDLPQDVKDRFQKCSKQSVNLARQDIPVLPSIGSDSPKEAVKRCRTNVGPKRIGAEEFLKKLPPVVVRDGKLVDIRGGVSSLIQTPKPSGTKYHTIKFDDNHPRIQLKIRSVDGEKIYLVHISAHRTIGDLRVGLDEMTRISGAEPTKYAIINPSSPTRGCGLNNNQLTFHQLGIVHNTVLYLQNAQRVDNATQK